MYVIILVMKLITRLDAIELKLTRYFTGQPCKRGHICNRYTKTAACIECLHPKFVTTESHQRKLDAITRREGKLLQQQERERIASILRMMEQIKIRLHDNDVLLFESAVLGAAICREPSLGMKDVRTRFVPKYWGSNQKLHAFKCFSPDKASLFVLQDSLESARRAVVPLSPQDRLAAVLEAADAEADAEWPEFKP